MSEQKRYTAKDFRHAVFARQARMNAVPLVHPTEDELDEMLEQAADTEEENAQLRARLDAVVKEIEGRDWINDGDLADSILRAARGKGGAE